jgi:spoIIIJ-associated protein
MQQTDNGCDWLKQLLDLMGYSTQVKEIVAPLVDPASTDINVWLEIDRTNLDESAISDLMGRDGSNLDAIQSLANLHLNLGKESDRDRHFYTIELNGYRAEQQERLRNLAESAANQVRETQQDYQIKHLSPAERRIVHMLLKECPDLETFSEGVEPHRYLIVRPSDT